MDKVFFALIRSAITGEKSDAIPHSPLSEDALAEWMTLAKKHDILHLLALALTENRLVPPDDTRFRRYVLKSALRCERLSHTYDNLCRALEAAKIPFMPLKGSVLRKYYREPWMRSSCDIDVLVHKENADGAAAYLIEHCGYTYERTTAHDISLFTPEKIHVELHFRLVSEDVVNKSSDVLACVWDNALLKEGYSYLYEMPDAMFYFYHIAHMGQHMLQGGCGIRPFIDLFILDRIEGVDTDGRRELLREADLLTFTEACQKLADVWFGEASMDCAAERMENYILRGGVYGTLKNLDTVRAARGETRLKSFLRIAFLPYDKLKTIYPTLDNHPLLFPFYQMKRWLRIFTKDKRKKVTRLTRIRNSVTNTEAATVAALFSDIGLYR